jgi:hypothetical protein
MFRVMRQIRKTREAELRRLARGWLISITAFILVGFTVHFWNVLHAYFFFYLGMAGWLADPLRVKLRRKVATSAEIPSERRKTRDEDVEEPRPPMRIPDPFAPVPPGFQPPFANPAHAF